MTSTNDGKNVKSNQTSGPKGKTYFIELYKFLEARLSEGSDASERTKHLCSAWRRVHSLCQHSAPSTHTHLISWLQRHTARTVLQAEWRTPERKGDRSSLEEAIDTFIAECRSASASRNGVSVSWETQLVDRGEWFKRNIDQPWAHPVLTLLLNPNGTPPTDDEVLKWLKEERGVTFVVRLQTLCEERLYDIAMSLAAAVMERVRASLPSVDDVSTDTDKQSSQSEKVSLSFGDRLKEEAGFSTDIWDLLTDIEFVLLHKRDSTRCIALAKQTPLAGAYHLIERLRKRLEISPREKKLWKNAREVAILIAQVVIARCMIVAVCGGAARTALYCCARLLAQLVPAPRLPPAADALAAQALSARHLHTLASAIDKQLSASTPSMKPYVCELYVRAITAGMNELERLKLKTEKEAEARLMERTLASWFVQMGAVLNASDRILCECSLTAFSLHPSLKMYEWLDKAPKPTPVAADSDESKEETTKSEFGSWANDSRSQTNFVKTSETLKMKQTQNQANVLSTAIFNEGEALGLSPELCQDIAVLLSGPRVKTLSWDMDRTLLLENCRTYMESTHGGTRVLTRELKFLNIDPNLYRHLPEDRDEDENDPYYGIERGYEHLVPPEDIWEDPYDDPEKTDSSSSYIEEDYLTPRRKQKNKCIVMSSDEDCNPLWVMEEKKVQKKKERTHSKERSKERVKKKTAVEPLLDPLHIEEEIPTQNKEQKPKKERKKKESVPKPKKSLASLICLKVVKKKKQPVKLTSTTSSPLITDSDYDSQGKNSLHSLNSEGDPEGHYDGLLSKEELKSVQLTSAHSFNSMGAKNNDEFNFARGKVEVINNPHQPLEGPLNNLTTMRYRSPTPNSVKQQSLLNHTKRNISPNNIRASLSNLLDFRRENPPQRKPAIITRDIPLQTNISPKAVAIPEIPKSYINKQQAEKLAEIEREVSQLLEASQKQSFSQIGKSCTQRKNDIDIIHAMSKKSVSMNSLHSAIPSPVIQYAKSSVSNNEITNVSHAQRAPSQSHVNPIKMKDIVDVSYDRLMAEIAERQDSRGKYDIVKLPHTQHRPVQPPSVHRSLNSISPGQRDYQNFIKEYEHAKYYSDRALDMTKGQSKNVRPVSKVVPVIPYSKIETKSHPCAKQPQQKKPDNSLNTFSRLSYMHKNKQNEMKNKQTPEKPVFNSSTYQEVSSELDEIIKKHQKEQMKVIQRKKEREKLLQNSSVVNQGISVIKPSKHSVLSNLLNHSTSSSLHCRKEIQHKNKMQQFPVSPPKTSLSQKDQNDLLQLLRQQNKLNTPQRTTTDFASKPSTSNFTNDTSDNTSPGINFNLTSCEKQQKVDKHISYVKTCPKSFEGKIINVISNSLIKPAYSINSDVSNTSHEVSVSAIPKQVVSCINTTKTIDLQKDVNKFDANKTHCQKISEHIPETEKPEWQTVMSEILKHKTPSRRPNAPDVTLNKNSFELAFERSLKESSIFALRPTITEMNHDSSKNEKKSDPPNLVKKINQYVIKSSNKVIKKQAEDNLKISSNKVLKTHIAGLKQQKNSEQKKYLNSNTQPAAIPKMNKPGSAVSKKQPQDNQRKQFTFTGPQHDDSYISGIPNSDYDLLEELMDDDLRKEIGELSSDDESYNAAAQSFLKPTKGSEKRVSVEFNKSLNDVAAQKSVTDVQCLIAGINDDITQSPAIKYDKKRTNASIKNIQIADKAQVDFCLNTANVISSSVTTAASANTSALAQTQSQTYKSVGTLCGNQVINSNIYVSSVTQRAPIRNLVLLGPEIAYERYSTVPSPVHGMTNVAPSAYVDVSIAPNMTLYQTTQFVAPVISPLIIGTSITVPVISNMISVETNMISHLPQSVSSTSVKIPTQTCPKKTVRSCDNQGEMRKLDTLIESPLQLINLDKTSERKVLSEVQELAALEITDKARDIKMESATNINKDKTKEQERLKNKRMAIINREICHRCGDKPIPLSYEPLPIKLQIPTKQHEFSEIISLAYGSRSHYDDDHKASDCDDHKASDCDDHKASDCDDHKASDCDDTHLQNNVCDPTKAINEASPVIPDSNESKENKSVSTVQCRRIVLRSSNKITSKSNAEIKMTAGSTKTSSECIRAVKRSTVKLKSVNYKSAIPDTSGNNTDDNSETRNQKRASKRLRNKTLKLNKTKEHERLVTKTVVKALSKNRHHNHPLEKLLPKHNKAVDIVDIEAELLGSKILKNIEIKHDESIDNEVNTNISAARKVNNNSSLGSNKQTTEVISSVKTTDEVVACRFMDKAAAHMEEKVIDNRNKIASNTTKDIVLISGKIIDELQVGDKPVIDKLNESEIIADLNQSGTLTVPELNNSNGAIGQPMITIHDKSVNIMKQTKSVQSIADNLTKAKVNTTMPNTTIGNSPVHSKIIESTAVDLKKDDTALDYIDELQANVAKSVISNTFSVIKNDLSDEVSSNTETTAIGNCDVTKGTEYVTNDQYTDKESVDLDMTVTSEEFIVPKMSFTHIESAKNKNIHNLETNNDNIKDNETSISVQANIERVMKMRAEKITEIYATKKVLHCENMMNDIKNDNVKYNQIKDDIKIMSDNVKDKQIHVEKVIDEIESINENLKDKQIRAEQINDDIEIINKNVKDKQILAEQIKSCEAHSEVSTLTDSTACNVMDNDIVMIDGNSKQTSTVPISKPVDLVQTQNSNEDTTSHNHSDLSKIPQSYKESLIIKHMPSDNPLYKCVLVTLPNGRKCKATVYGEVNVTFDTLFACPSIKAALMNKITSKKLFMNVNQIITVDKSDRNKILSAQIQDVRGTAFTGPVETIDLLSDDEDNSAGQVDTREVQAFDTQFGKYKISPIDSDVFTKHKAKLSQQSIVSLKKLTPNMYSLSNIDSLPDTNVNIPNDGKLNQCDYILPSIPDKYLLGLFNDIENKLTSETNKSSLNVPEIVEIDDSSNDSVGSTRHMNRSPDIIDELKDELLKQLRVEVSGSKKRVIQEKSSDKNITRTIKKINAPKASSLQNEMLKQRINFADKLLSPDSFYNITKEEQLKIINRKCEIKLLRCDNLVKMDEEKDQDNIEIPPHEPIAITEDFSIPNYLDSNIVEAYARSCSPVIELSDVLVSLTCSAEWYDTKLMVHSQSISEDLSYVFGKDGGTPDSRSVKDTEVFKVLTEVNCAPSLLSLSIKYLLEAQFIRHQYTSFHDAIQQQSVNKNLTSKVFDKKDEPTISGIDLFSAVKIPNMSCPAGFIPSLTYLVLKYLDETNFTNHYMTSYAPVMSLKRKSTTLIRTTKPKVTKLDKQIKELKLNECSSPSVDLESFISVNNNVPIEDTKKVQRLEIGHGDSAQLSINNTSTDVTKDMKPSCGTSCEYLNSCENNIVEHNTVISGDSESCHNDIDDAIHLNMKTSEKVLIGDDKEIKDQISPHTVDTNQVVPIDATNISVSQNTDAENGEVPECTVSLKQSEKVTDTKPTVKEENTEQGVVSGTIDALGASTSEMPINIDAFFIDSPMKNSCFIDTNENVQDNASLKKEKDETTIDIQILGYSAQAQTSLTLYSSELNRNNSVETAHPANSVFSQIPISMASTSVNNKPDDNSIEVNMLIDKTTQTVFLEDSVSSDITGISAKDNNIQTELKLPIKITDQNIETHDEEPDIKKNVSPTVPMTIDALNVNEVCKSLDTLKDIQICNIGLEIPTTDIIILKDSVSSQIYVQSKYEKSVNDVALDINFDKTMQIESNLSDATTNIDLKKKEDRAISNISGASCASKETCIDGIFDVSMKKINTIDIALKNDTSAISTLDNTALARLPKTIGTSKMISINSDIDVKNFLAPSEVPNFMDIDIKTTMHKELPILIHDKKEEVEACVSVAVNCRNIKLFDKETSEVNRMDLEILEKAISLQIPDAKQEIDIIEQKTPTETQNNEHRQNLDKLAVSAIDKYPNIPEAATTENVHLEDLCKVGRNKIKQEVDVGSKTKQVDNKTPKVINAVDNLNVNATYIPRDTQSPMKKYNTKTSEVDACKSLHVGNKIAPEDITMNIEKCVYSKPTPIHLITDNNILDRSVIETTTLTEYMLTTDIRDFDISANDITIGTKTSKVKSDHEIPYGYYDIRYVDDENTQCTILNTTDKPGMETGILERRPLVHIPLTVHVSQTQPIDKHLAVINVTPSENELRKVDNMGQDNGVSENRNIKNTRPNSASDNNRGVHNTAKKIESTHIGHYKNRVLSQAHENISGNDVPEVDITNIDLGRISAANDIPEVVINIQTQDVSKLSRIRVTKNVSDMSLGSNVVDQNFVNKHFERNNTVLEIDTEKNDIDSVLPLQSYIIETSITNLGYDSLNKRDECLNKNKESEDSEDILCQASSDENMGTKLIVPEIDSKYVELLGNNVISQTLEVKDMSLHVNKSDNSVTGTGQVMDRIHEGNDNLNNSKEYKMCDDSSASIDVTQEIALNSDIRVNLNKDTDRTFETQVNQDIDVFQESIQCHTLQTTEITNIILNKNIKRHLEHLEGNGLSEKELPDNLPSTIKHENNIEKKNEPESLVPFIDTRHIDTYEDSDLTDASDIIEDFAQTHVFSVGDRINLNSHVVETGTLVSEIEARATSTDIDGVNSIEDDLCVPDKTVKADNMVPEELKRIKTHRDSFSSDTSEIIDITQIYSTKIDASMCHHSQMIETEQIGMETVDITSHKDPLIHQTALSEKLTTISVTKATADENMGMTQAVLKRHENNTLPGGHKTDVVDIKRLLCTPTVIDAARIFMTESNTKGKEPLPGVKRASTDAKSNIKNCMETESFSIDTDTTANTESKTEVKSCNIIDGFDIEICHEKNVIVNSNFATSSSQTGNVLECAKNKSCAYSPVLDGTKCSASNNDDSIEARLAIIVGEPLIDCDIGKTSYLEDCLAEKSKFVLEDAELTSLITESLDEEYVVVQCIVECEEIRENVSNDVTASIKEIMPDYHKTISDHEYVTSPSAMSGTIIESAEDQYESTYISTKNWIFLSEDKPDGEFIEEIVEMNSDEVLDDIYLDNYLSRSNSQQNSCNLESDQVSTAINDDWTSRKVEQKGNLSEKKHNIDQANICYQSTFDATADIVDGKRDRICDFTTQNKMVSKAISEDCSNGNKCAKTPANNIENEIEATLTTVAVIEEVITSEEVNLLRKHASVHEGEQYEGLKRRMGFVENDPKPNILSYDNYIETVASLEIPALGVTKDDKISNPIDRFCVSTETNQKDSQNCDDIEARLAEIVGEPLTHIDIQDQKVKSSYMNLAKLYEGDGKSASKLPLQEKFTIPYSAEEAETITMPVTNFEGITPQLRITEFQGYTQTLGKDSTCNASIKKKVEKIHKPDVDDIDKLKMEVPKITYSRSTDYVREPWTNLKRKMNMTDIKTKAKKYRKGKNIDYPKITAASISENAYTKENRRLLEYCSSVKFSYAIPFHKDNIDVHNTLMSWPIESREPALSEDLMDKDEILFTDVESPQAISDPLKQTLYQEMHSEYDENSYKPVNIDETNFSMGFGEGSDRVIHESKDGEYRTFSAATLSDVKQIQPRLPSDKQNVRLKQDNFIENNIKDENLKLRRFIDHLNVREKVRSFFAKSIAELKWNLNDKKDDMDYNDLFNSPFSFTSPRHIRPSSIEIMTNVVQVGQLPVSAAAQNPVTCDPRVTHVSNVSPSQCSLESSPNDDIQTTIKTEYTELTTADITIPLMQEYAQHYSMPTEHHEPTNLYGSDENEPRATQIKSIVKIEFMEETSPENMDETESYESNSFQEMSNDIVNTQYQFGTIDNNGTVEPKPNSQTVANSTDKSVEPFTEDKEHHNKFDKSDQIAHAMSAAGITSSQSTGNSKSGETQINTMPHSTQSDVVTTSQADINSYPKSTPINAIALQQALAQILPPPLNQSNTSENNQHATHTPVLHIVQGNNTQSVLNKPNGPQLLHIVQSKSTTATNGTPVSQSNTFGGLSLVDGAIQQNGNQLLHIVNTGNQKNNASQLLKRVNLLTNLTNVQGCNEQKMVQFVCKSADGKSIQLPHQRSMVLRLQPIDPCNAPTTPKQNEAHDHNTPSSNNNQLLNGKESSPQEIKSRSLYEENYAKFVQDGDSKPGIEKSTSLPKFNQVFGKQVYQEKSSELDSDNLPEPSECSSEGNNVSLEQMTESPMMVRKPQSQPQATPNLVQQIKQSIGPMNIQTMHGGVIYTRQIPVNIGNGQTINLITVPSTELGDDPSQKQQKHQEGDTPIIKIIPTSQVATTSNGSTEEKNTKIGTTNDTNPQPNSQSQAQPVLTQMRIKLPMLSKAPHMVGGTRVMRPSFFQIQRNVIGGANQQVYQQLVLTAAPPLGQSIRLPTPAQKPKTSSESQSSQESQMSSSTLEQLREFDMVLEQVKERSTVQPGTSASTNNFSKLNTSADTTDASAPGTSTQEPSPPVLYSVSNTQPLNMVNYLNRKSTITSTTTSSYVRSPDSTGIIESASSSTHSNLTHPVTSESCASSSCASEAASTAVQPKPKKKKPKPSTSNSNPFNIKNTPKPSSQKPLEDEQTTQRILYILAEYKEQVENSPDKDKPAPRRRNNPAAPNTGSSKRKKSSSGSRRPDMSPVQGEDSCRTMGSEDSSCGTSLGECNDCVESHSPEEGPPKVVRRLTFEQETITQTRTIPQRNVIVADGQAFAVRNPTGKPATTVLMPANYLLPVSMVKGGQQIAIVTNRGPKLLVGAGEGGAGGTLLFQRLLGPGLKPVLTRPGVRHIRLPTAALHNLQAFNIASPATSVQPPDSTAPLASAPNPPDLVDTRAMSSPWPDRDSSDGKPDGGNSSPEGSEPWNLPSSSIADDYGYEEIVRTDNMDRTVLDAIPDRYSPDMEAQRIFDKMFDADSKKSMYDSRCGYDIDASDDDKAYHQVVQRKDGRQTRLTHVSTASLRHKYAILEHELRLQKSLSEECEDLGVDSPSASELFPEAELLFVPSPAQEQTIDQCHTPQPTILSQGIPQPDLDDQIATDQLLTHKDHEDLDINLDDVGEIVTVGEDGMTTIPLDHEEFARSHEEFARSHPNTTFHSEPEDSEIPPFTIAQGIKGRQITFHARGVPGTVVMSPQTTVISQATIEATGTQNAVKFTDIDNIINAMPTIAHHHPQNVNIQSVLVKDGNESLTKFDRLLNESKEVQLANTASAIVHSTGNSTQVIRRVHYETRRDSRYMIDESDGLISGEPKSDDRNVQCEDTPSPERHPELFWDSTPTRPERRRFDFSSDSDKCCKSPYDDNNSNSSGIGAHTRLDSVIKAARTERRRSDGSSAEDNHPPLRTYPPKRPHLHSHPHHSEVERSSTGKSRASDRCHEGKDESRRRASNRGVVKRGCHCCNGSTAPPKPKKSRPKKANEFPN